jgi:cell shape-determining protein MreD
METSTVQSLKLSLVQLVGLSKDALHIYVGLIVFFVVAIVIAVRIERTSYLLLMAVIAVAILGELVDMRDDINSLGVWRWRASVHDVANTVFWPFVITLLVRAKVFSANKNR